VVPEAPLERNDAGGAYPSGDGWFVVNARAAQWFDSVELGLYAPFEGEHASFKQLGMNLSILRPGEPACMYHAEEAQEGFLLLSGEALLLIEGQERALRRWDYVHCPPWTEHVVIGAGEAPCVLLVVPSVHRPWAMPRGQRTSGPRGAARPRRPRTGSPRLLCTRRSRRAPLRGDGWWRAR
jgi:quercetin dioxygenase-like cupin family protein